MCFFGSNPKELMGGFLTIGYCLRTVGHCFPYCFLEIFVGEKALMEGTKL